MDMFILFLKLLIILIVLYLLKSQKEYPEKYITILNENVGFGKLKFDEYQKSISIIINSNGSEYL